MKRTIGLIIAILLFVITLLARTTADASADTGTPTATAPPTVMPATPTSTATMSTCNPQITNIRAEWERTVQITGWFFLPCVTDDIGAIDVWYQTSPNADSARDVAWIRIGRANLTARESNDYDVLYLTIPSDLPSSGVLQLTIGLTGARSNWYPFQLPVAVQPTPTRTAIPTVTPTVDVIPIVAGWNLINVYPFATAEEVLQSMQAQGIGATQVAQWERGTWSVHLLGNIADFPIDGRTYGYFVRSRNAGTWVKNTNEHPPT